MDKVLARIAALPPGRRLVALAGPPGAGKSTLAAALAEALGARAVVLPMDGFHLDNRLLAPRGLLPRKGAPQTFDAAGFRALIARVSAGEDAVFPLFDRDRDVAIGGAGQVTGADRVVIVEGNYLMLQDPDWRGLHPFWDLSVMVTAPFAVLQDRLVRRWLDQGLSADAALARALQNDIPNAQAVLDRSAAADLTFVAG